MDDNLMDIIEDFERTYEGIDWDELEVHMEIIYKEGTNE